MKRASLALSLLLLGVTACGDDSTGGGTCDPGIDECVVPWDCPLGFTCGESGCCEEFGCTPDSCPTGEFCTEELVCESISSLCNNFGCECHILNTAGEFEASGDPTITLAPGAQLDVQAVLAAQGGAPLPGATFSFSATGPFSVSGSTLTASASGTSATGQLTADAGGFATCTADLVNIGDGPTGNDVRFFVYDDATGAPKSGATILVDMSPYDGIAEHTLTTNDDGLATTTGAAAGDFAVSAFLTDYNYLSVVGLNATTDNDYALPLTARPAAPTTGGFTGKADFDPYEKIVLGGVEKTFKFGIVSSSFPLRSLLAFDLDMFIGPMTDADCSVLDGNGNPPPGCYRVNLSQFNFDDTVPLPGGLLLSAIGNPIKTHFDVVGAPGRRFGWTLGGEVELGDLDDLLGYLLPAFTGCSCDVTTDACDAACTCDFDCGINFGALFDGLVPLFSLFASGAKGNLPLIAEPLPTWETHITPPYGANRSEHPSFPKLDAGGYGQLAIREPLQVFTDFDVPPLPADPEYIGVDDREMEGMILLSGVNTVGFGFVPLGIGVGLDCTEGNCLDRDGSSGTTPGVFDGDVNGGPVCSYDPDPAFNACPPTVPDATAQGGVADGHIGLFHAKAHSGLEQQEWLTLAIALPISSLTSGDAAIRASAAVVREEPQVGASTQLSSLTYPGYPAQPATMFDPATNSRRYVVTATSGIDLNWVTMATPADSTSGVTTRWNIYMPGGGADFVAPDVPSGWADPFAPAGANEDIPQGHVNATHVGFSLAGGAQLSDLAAANGSTLATVVDVVDGFTIQSRDICALASCP